MGVAVMGLLQKWHISESQQGLSEQGRGRNVESLGLMPCCGL